MSGVDFPVLMPEIVLALYAMLALLVAVYTGRDTLTGALTWATAGVFGAVALWIGMADWGTMTGWDGMVINDAFARFAKVTILLSAAGVLVMSQDYMARHGLGRFEYPILVTLSVIGMLVMVSSGDLLTLYMGLELQSLALYVIAAMNRNDARSTEAGLKYFVLGAISSGFLLYGASLTYGYAGTTQFAGILSTLGGEAPIGLIFGLVFVLAGLAFKVSAAPFHMWTPDVYEGAPTPVTAFFATAPKMAAMALIARVIHDAFGAIPSDWIQILAALAVVSMFLGAIAAIGQKDLKRLMAYSSIAHMGYALVGLAAGTTSGVQATLIYMAIYVTMNLGAFAFILSLERNGKPMTAISDLHLFARVEPFKAFAMLILLFSLAGVPPMLGFFGKFYVLKAAVDAQMVWLAVAGAVASVIGAYYYLRIVYFMYFGDEVAPVQSNMSAVQWVVFAGVAVAMLLGVVNLFGVEPIALRAAEALLG